MSNTERAERIVLVDYLRGIAAAMVAWFHLTNGYDSWVASTGTHGWLGVEIFFVISGFAITFALSRDGEGWSARRFGDFMISRLIRLEPPYIASVLITVALLYLSAMVPGFQGEQPQVQLPQLLSHIAYLIPLTPYEWLQPVYWTLTYEFVFYIVAGLTFPVLLWRGGRMFFCLGAGIVTALVVLNLLSPLVLLFVMGVAACRTVLGQDRWWFGGFIVLVATLAMALAGYGLQGVAGLVTAALIAAHKFLPKPTGPVAAILRFLGLISYSLYLVHVPIGGRIVNLGNRFVETPLQQLALSALAFLVSCATAFAFWWLLERPALRAAHNFRRRSLAAAQRTGCS